MKIEESRELFRSIVVNNTKASWRIAPPSRLDSLSITSSPPSQLPSSAEFVRVTSSNLVIRWSLKSWKTRGDPDGGVCLQGKWSLLRNPNETSSTPSRGDWFIQWSLSRTRILITLWTFWSVLVQDFAVYHAFKLLNARSDCSSVCRIAVSRLCSLFTCFL